jgi:hypothetical protein
VNFSVLHFHIPSFAYSLIIATEICGPKVIDGVAVTPVVGNARLGTETVAGIDVINGIAAVVAGRCYRRGGVGRVGIRKCRQPNHLKQERLRLKPERVLRPLSRVLFRSP